ncbi:hypothetical protein L5D93_21355 [Paenibacillus thiaminolyticus]|nr:hypothetical protein [Paenibacillus thiaminolyticus]
MGKMKYVKLSLLILFFTLPFNANAQTTKGDEMLKTAKEKVNVSQVMEQKIESCFERESRILPPLQTMIEKVKGKKKEEKIEVSIMLRYDSNVTKEAFIRQHDDLLMTPLPTLMGLESIVFTKLNIEQIHKLADFDEISSISTTDDVVSVY